MVSLSCIVTFGSQDREVRLVLSWWSRGASGDLRGEWVERKCVGGTWEWPRRLCGSVQRSTERTGPKKDRSLSVPVGACRWAEKGQLVLDDAVGGEDRVTHGWPEDPCQKEWKKVWKVVEYRNKSYFGKDPRGRRGTFQGCKKTSFEEYS